jgi:hypothetical protein
MRVAAARIRARFDRDAVCAQLTALYDDVIRETRGHRAASLAAGPRVAERRDTRDSGRRVMVLLPAHNEARNLPRVVADIRAHYPALDILVVNDGSSDGTEGLLGDLGVRWLSWEDRRGIGAALRAGLRYAARNGFDLVVRVDADGQHGAEDIEEVIRPIFDARAEVVLGSRYARQRPRRQGTLRFLQWALDWCLSTITRREVTDATSGFCALGPQAIRMLAEHHPTGYPEPELRLFLSRNALRVLEVPVQARTRLSGRTSLTPVRLATAAARVLLAMVIVPLRPTVQPPGD